MNQTVNAKPKKSVHALRPQERSMGSIVKIEVPGGELGEAQQDLAGDIFWQMYSREPHLRDDVPAGREINRRLLDWMNGVAGFTASKSECMGSLAASRAASSLMYQHLTKDEILQEAMKQQEEADKAEQERAAEQAAADAMNRMGDGEAAQQHQQAADKAAQRAQQAIAQAQASLEGLEGDRVSSAALTAAFRQAEQDAKDINETMKAWGLGDGSRDVQTADRFFELYTEQVKRIAKIIGRVKGIAARARRTRVVTGFAPVDMVLTQDVTQLMPEELARLHPSAPDAVRKLALIEYVENGLLGWQLGGDGEESGPFVAALDRSGSMMGEDLETGLGIVLGLAFVAREEGRRYILGTFNHRGGGILQVCSEDSWEKHLVWANQQASGGTDFDAALEWSQATIEGFEGTVDGTDLVFVTDGWARISPKNLEHWAAFNERTGSRFFYVPVNAQALNANPQLTELADRVMPLDKLSGNVDELAETVAGWMK